jgi:hypothetical protein
MIPWELVFIHDHEGGVGIIMTSPDGTSFEALEISSMRFLGCRPTKAEAGGARARQQRDDLA